MKLSTRVRYGTRALVDLAIHQGKGPALLKDIAAREQISLPYLRHLVTPLVTNGIVRSTRGPRGGVTLTRPPEEVKMSDVIQLLDGSICPAECSENPEACSRSSACATRDLWEMVNKAITGVLETTTLNDLVEWQKSKERFREPMYYI
ncbi:MAG: Rrf2 family transcriptional regulator [Chloroflexota bacterium]